MEAAVQHTEGPLERGVRSGGTVGSGEMAEDRGRGGEMAEDVGRLGGMVGVGRSTEGVVRLCAAYPSSNGGDQPM